MHGGHQQPHPQQYQPPYGQQGHPAQQPPAAPYMPAPQQYPPAVPGQPQVYRGPLPGGDPKAQAWKNYGMQWLLGLGFLAVIVVFVTIYNLATGEW
jgi:hypothetical protein